MAAFLEVEEVEEIQLMPIQFWQRFGNQEPGLPSLPIPDLDFLTSYCDDDKATYHRNLSTRSPPIQLDSHHYYAQTLPGKPDRGPQFKSRFTKAEYRFLSVEEMSQAERPLLPMSQLMNNVNISVLKVIFLVLDAIIVIYRCSRTYITVMSLCRGFEESRTLKADASAQDKEDKSEKELELQNLRNQMKNMSADEHGSEDVSGKEEREMTPLDGSMTDTSGALDSQRCMLRDKGSGDTYQSIIGSRGVAELLGTSSREPAPRKLEYYMYRLGQILQASLMPKIIISCVLLVLFYVVVTVTCHAVTLEMLTHYDGFKPFLSGLDTRLNHTNAYLMDQAKHLNDVVMKIYEHQMKSELLNLETMMQHFNLEQKRLVDNYVAEACAVKQELLGNRSCDVSIAPMKVVIPMLPCNFVPIQPRLNKVFTPHVYISQLQRDFQPFVTAARNVVLKAGYTVLVTCAAMLIFHVFGSVLFHFLKTRHKFPVRWVFVTSIPPMRGEQRAPEDSDFDEDESGFKSLHVRLSPKKPYTRPETIVADFKYSETKV